MLSINLERGKPCNKVYSCYKDDNIIFIRKESNLNMVHLPLRKLLAFHYNQLHADEKEDVQAHLEICAACEKNLTLLVKPERLLQSKPASTGTRVTENSQSTCLSLEMIGKYINAEQLPAEIPPVEKHLASCDSCRQQFIALAECCTQPLSAETQQKIASLPPHKISAHVNAIQKIIQQSGDHEKIPVTLKPRRPWWPLTQTPRPVFVAILLLIATGMGWLLPLYRYHRLVKQGEAELLSQHHVYYLSEIRLAGGFSPSTGIERMAPNPKPQKLDTLLRQALTLKENGQKGLRNLARYYLLKKNDLAADSVLKILEAQAPRDAAVRNDRGYWFYQRGQYDAAAAAFTEAFALDPRLDEALFNLAATHAQRGDTTAAQATWEEYLKLDPLKPEWRKAAQARLQTLK